MSASMPMDNPKVGEPLGDPELRRFLLDFVKRRVPSADADDIVQTVLVEALVAKNRPADATELRKYLLGIARHKVADVHRRHAREEVTEPPEIVAEPPPVEEEALVRWVERQAPPTDEAKKTLAWMAREGEGEKLESIAAEEQVPAARVRQRVSRMRRWMKERWLAELAAVAALAVLAFVLYRVLKNPEDVEAVRPDDSATPVPETPLDRAKALRAEALRRCDEADWQRCLEGLDDAKTLDPAGDLAEDVQAARDRARRALEPPKTNSTTELAPKEAPTETKELKTAPSPRTTSTSKEAPKKNIPPKPAPKGKPSAAPLDFGKNAPAPAKKGSKEK